MKFLGTNRPFLTSIGSFQGLPAEVLEVILLPQRLALTYSTTFNPFLQAFFQTFSAFFVLCIQGPVFHCKQGSFWLHFILSSYLYILYISTPCVFGHPFMKYKQNSISAAELVQTWSFVFLIRFSLPASSAAGSARRPVPAWAAYRSGQWAWGPIHCNKRPPGWSAPQTALPPH